MVVTTQKPTGEKKPKSAASHPPYLVMIQEAIVTLKERSGSSQYAIAKHIEANHSSSLPQNFKKILLVQLKKLVADGKLVKVKNSFKLSPLLKASKPVAPVEKRPNKAKVVAEPKKAKVVEEEPKKVKVVSAQELECQNGSNCRPPVVKKPGGPRYSIFERSSPLKMKLVAAKKAKSIKPPAKKGVGKKK